MRPGRVGRSLVDIEALTTRRDTRQDERPHIHSEFVGRDEHMRDIGTQERDPRHGIGSADADGYRGLGPRDPHAHGRGGHRRAHLPRRSNRACVPGLSTGEDSRRLRNGWRAIDEFHRMPVLRQGSSRRDAHGTCSVDGDGEGAMR
jgi:hypothetical protein